MKTNTKSKLLSSLLVLCLCVTMFAGATYAWFTDTVTSSGNLIKSGTLDVDLVNEAGQSMANQTIKWEAKDGRAQDEILWEPGCTYKMEPVYVVNKGNLNLKYKLTIKGVEGDAKLLEVIDWTVNGDTSNLNGFEGTLAPGAKTDAIVIQGHMQESANNDYQGLSINGGISIIVEATQLDVEEDSFDNTYDAVIPDTDWYTANPNATEFTIDTAEELAGLAEIVNGTAKSNAATVALAADDTTAAATIHDDFEGNTIKLGADINLKNVVWTPIGRPASDTSTTDFTYAFRGTFDGQNHKVSNYRVSQYGFAGLFGLAYKAEINNIQVENVTINANRMAGAVVGQLYGSIDNCDVTNATITVVPNAVANGYDNGDKVGGVVGWIGDNGNNRTLKNCDVSDVTLKAYRDVGGVAGYAAWSTTISGNTVTGLNITVDQITNHYGTKDVNAGAIWGRNSVSSTNEGVHASGNTGEVEPVLNLMAGNTTDAIKKALESGATTVQVPAGTYTFPASSIGEGVTIKCDEGTVFEGTSSLNINGATVIGATFENEGQAVSGTIHGTFKDCTFEGSEALRWCYTGEGETAVFENCVIKTDFRGFHFDTMNGDVTFRNCEINGFNAYGGNGTATFEGCTFGNDESSYNGLNIYSNTVLKDCTFKFESGKTNFIDMEGTGKTLTITNCTATLDGAAANISNFVGGSMLAQNTVIYN